MDPAAAAAPAAQTTPPGGTHQQTPEAVRALITEALGLLGSIASRYPRDGCRPGRRWEGLPDSADHDDMVAAGEVVAAVLPQNVDKNRYCNVCPFDANRVVLRRPAAAGEGATDYVNASHIELPHVRAIASQGPTHPDWHGQDTTGDFWHAVWENSVEVVVALAKVQAGFSGSAQYWPAEEGDGLVVRGPPDLTVSMVSESSGPHFTTRLLRLTRKEGTLGAVPSSREVTHLHYTNWPNYGVPDNADDVAMLLRTVNSPALSTRHPIWVHCSGGVGRTGVFLTALSAYPLLTPVYSYS